jgi:hypothetical protein
MFNEGTNVLMLVQTLTSTACFLAGLALIAWSVSNKLKVQKAEPLAEVAQDFRTAA